MKFKKSLECEPTFVPYDDNNIMHVLAGPDYGQIDSGSKLLAWDEISSKEYESFVEYLTEKIISKKIKIW